MSADARTIHQVFGAAKASFRYTSDMAVYHECEHWCAPKEMQDQLSTQGYLLGDCDDFASLCVMLARKIGLPARFVLCLTETDETHLVCEIDGWVLDNRRPDVTRRDDLNYTWLAISGYAKGDPWHTVA